MYHISETKKQNVVKAIQAKRTTEAAYTSLKSGKVLLRYKGTSAILSPEDSTSFLDSVRKVATDTLQRAKLVAKFFPQAETV